jgi:hypothetical protein
VQKKIRRSLCFGLPKHIPCARSLYCAKLSEAEERNLRTVLPTGLAVPKFNRFDHAAIARQIDGARLAASGNPVANDKLFMRAVVEMNDDLLEEDLATFDAQLDGAETAIVLADVNVVVILGSVNVSVAEIVPTALRLCANRGECESEEKSNGSECNSFEHVSSVTISVRGHQSSQSKNWWFDADIALRVPVLRLLGAVYETQGGGKCCDGIVVHVADVHGGARTTEKKKRRQDASATDDG